MASGGSIEPLRLALRFAPPGIVVEYVLTAQRASSCEQRLLFHHEIDLQDALLRGARTRTSNALNIDAIVADLVAAHAHVLGGRKVSSRQVLLDTSTFIHWYQSKPTAER